MVRIYTGNFRRVGYGVARIVVSVQQTVAMDVISIGNKIIELLIFKLLISDLK